VIRPPLLILLATAGLAACATPPDLTVRARSAPPAAGIIAPPGQELAAVAPADDAAIDALLPDTPVDVALPPQPVPQFLDAVLGEILGLPYGLGPNVAARREVVALSTGGAVSRRALFRIVETTLRDYGLRLRLQGGAVSVVEDSAPAARLAAVLRGAAPQALGAQTPEALRTVVVAQPLAVLAADDLRGLLVGLLPQGAAIELRVEPRANALVLTGPAAEVASMLEIVRRLDQPALAGARAIQLTPAVLSPQAFARALETEAAADAEAAGSNAVPPLSIMPLPSRGQVLVFVRDDEQAAAVRRWALAADRPAPSPDGVVTFVYRARNLEAQALGSLLSTNIAAPRSEARVPVGVPGAPPAMTEPAALDSPGAPAGALATGGALVVDTIGNRLIFTGTAAEYARLRPALDALDAAPGQVMVEVTIAEVTLTDATRLGLEWFFSQSQSNGVLSGGTQGGLGLAAGGLELKFNGPDLRAAFNAFASNNAVNILSRPRLVTRSGAEAQIQVGADVPIITSQTAANVQTGGNTDVLQTVQYRQTGVILKIKPVVYAGDRIDLEISQEVSSQQPNNNAAISSPLFLNRSASTTLSLVDGSTAVIGGLMDDNFTRGNNGVPFLKDVPLLGSAFRTDTVNGKKTELVILVTPFIVRDAGELAAAARDMAAMANGAFAGGLRSYTLSPWRAPLSGPRAAAASPSGPP